MENSDQVDQVSIRENEIDQATSDSVKKHEDTQSAKDNEDGVIEDESIPEHTATPQGDLPRQPQSHLATPEGPEESLTESRTVDGSSIAGSSDGSSSHGLIVENEGGAEFEQVHTHGFDIPY